MPDVRLIDANALKTEMADDLAATIRMSEMRKPDMAVRVLNKIDEANTIDAVPVVHARWVHEQRYGDGGCWVWRCSACRREAISPIISALKYCHSCGARMDAKEG